MEFWNDLSKKITDVADTTVKGAEKLTDMARMKYNLSVEKGNLEDLYTEIGRLRYDELRSGTDHAETITDACMKADTVMAQIRTLEKKLADLKRYRFCDNCGARIDREVKYCPECGTKQE